MDVNRQRSRPEHGDDPTGDAREPLGLRPREGNEKRRFGRAGREAL
jgi:hypothetical protein